MRPRLYEHGKMERHLTSLSVIVDAETGESELQKTRTKQQFLEDTKISSMLERFTRTGVMDTNRQAPQYLDLAELPTFKAALDLTCQVEGAFRSLPGRVQAEFKHDEEAFVEWILDPDNSGEARDRGLLSPLPKAATDAIEAAKAKAAEASGGTSRDTKQKPSADSKKPKKEGETPSEDTGS